MNVQGVMFHGGGQTTKRHVRKIEVNISSLGQHQFNPTISGIEKIRDMETQRRMLS